MRRGPKDDHGPLDAGLSRTRVGRLAPAQCGPVYAGGEYAVDHSGLSAMALCRRLGSGGDHVGPLGGLRGIAPSAATASGHLGRSRLHGCQSHGALDARRVAVGVVDDDRGLWRAASGHRALGALSPSSAHPMAVAGGVQRGLADLARRPRRALVPVASRNFVSCGRMMSPQKR